MPIVSCVQSYVISHSFLTTATQISIPGDKSWVRNGV